MSAAPRNQSKPTGKASPRINEVGPIQDKKTFLASLVGSGSCESDCCYAWFSGCTEGSVSCSNTACSVTCDGQSASYTCDGDLDN